MSIFRGAAVALVTPFLPNGDINFDKLDELIEFQIAGGTDCIVSLGTSGEASTISEEDHSKTVAFVCERVKKRIPVIAGTGSNCTETAIQLSRDAEEAGADGVLIVSPYYNKTTQRGLVAHFGAIADAIKIPIIAYNIPGRTGMNIAPETMVKMAKEFKNIVGVKEASGNISQIVKLASLADGCLDIYSGDDDQTIPLMSIGGLGVISVLSNIAPGKVHEMTQAFFDGDTAKAMKMQLEAIPLIEALFCETNPIPVKEAMNMMGMEVGGYRLPLLEMAPENKERLRRELTAYGLLSR